MMAIDELQDNDKFSVHEQYPIEIIESVTYGAKECSQIGLKPARLQE